MDDFEPIEEMPVLVKKTQWGTTLAKISYLNRWYLVKVYDNQRAAGNILSKLRKAYPKYKFVANVTDTGSKMYAMKIA